MKRRTRPKIAIAHDYLTQRGGAERVVLALARAFPDAPIYTTLYHPGGTYPEFREHDIRTSWGNSIGVLRRHHRMALPLLAPLSASMTVDADITIASSSGWSHGFRTYGKKLAYCYSPARWLYQRDLYLGDNPSPVESVGLSLLAPMLKRWDQGAATTVDRYIAISTAVRDRVKETYGRDSTVVPAPYTMDVNVETVPIENRWFREPRNENFLLTVSRLLPYKNVDAVLAALRLRPNRRLVVVGAGPEGLRLREEAPPNVLFLDNLSDGEMRWLYANCAGLIAASNEDFGLTPLEAAAHGKPSIVLRAGGYLDTMVEWQTAVFFDRPTPGDIAAAIDIASQVAWDAETLRERAQHFSEEAFVQRMSHAIESLADQSRCEKARG